jgi:hypothetical protein
VAHTRSSWPPRCCRRRHGRPARCAPATGFCRPDLEPVTGNHCHVGIPGLACRSRAGTRSGHREGRPPRWELPGVRPHTRLWTRSCPAVPGAQVAAGTGPPPGGGARRRFVAAPAVQGSAGRRGRGRRNDASGPGPAPRRRGLPGARISDDTSERAGAGPGRGFLGVRRWASRRRLSVPAWHIRDAGRGAESVGTRPRRAPRGCAGRRFPAGQMWVTGTSLTVVAKNR